jgi:hypothetical protein
MEDTWVERQSMSNTAVCELASSSSSLARTSPEQSSSLELPRTPPRESSLRNGSGSSKASHLISTISSLQSATINEDRKARLGTTQLTFSTSEAERKVRSYGEWISAWKKASRAIVFAFPHRADELDDYFLHIQAEFDSKQVGAHAKVILYDITVRNFVGGGQSILLVERDRFSHLYSPLSSPMALNSLPPLGGRERLLPTLPDALKPVTNTTPPPDAPIILADIATTANHAARTVTIDQSVAVERNNEG